MSDSMRHFRFDSWERATKSGCVPYGLQQHGSCVTWRALAGCRTRIRPTLSCSLTRAVSSSLVSGYGIFSANTLPRQAVRRQHSVINISIPIPCGTEPLLRFSSPESILEPMPRSPSSTYLSAQHRSMNVELNVHLRALLSAVRARRRRTAVPPESFMDNFVGAVLRYINTTSEATFKPGNQREITFSPNRTTHLINGKVVVYGNAVPRSQDM